MDGLPNTLRLALSRFQMARPTTTVLLPTNKTSFSAYEITVFDMPRVPVDLLSCTLSCDIGLSAATTAASTGSFYLADLIKTMRVYIGGVLVGHEMVSDYGLQYHLKRKWAEPAYKNKDSNAVYEYLPLTPNLANQAATITIQCSDILSWLASRNMRIYPLDVLQGMRIEVEWGNLQNRVNGLTSGTVSYTPKMVFSTLEYKGAAYQTAVRSRLAGEGIEVAFDNATLYIGNTIQNSGEYQFVFAAQALDTLLITAQNPAITAANYFQTTAGANTATVQIYQNAVPLSNLPLTVSDCWAVSMQALDGGSNVLVDPQVSSSTDFLNNSFGLLARFDHPVQGSAERHSLITGMSTEGQTLPHRVLWNSVGATGITPVAIAWHTSTFVVRADPAGIIAIAVAK